MELPATRASLKVFPGLFFLITVVLFLNTAVQSQTKSTAKPAASSKSDALTNKSVIDLHKAGLGDDIILTKIARSKCAFDLSTEGLIDLKSKGISADVIKAMMNKTEPGTGSSTAAASGTAKEPGKSNNTVGTPHLSPELVNHVYVLQIGQSLLPLEKSVAGKRTRNFGFKGVQVLQVDGANSGVSLSADEIQYFLINVGATLPELSLYTLKSAKGKREVESMSVGTFSGAKTGEKNQIPLNISKLDNGIYKIETAKAMEKGEYFFTTKPEATATSFDVYTFGVK